MAKTHPTADISFGQIIGRSEKGINRFLGVPFAAPPWGENRFSLPQPPKPWDEPLECADFGATAPQSPYPGRMGEILGSIKIPGENTLTINIWAPENAKDLPVVLWLHGGAFERGSAALDVYDGTNFARDGVVFASINYRLGIEGFSVLPDAPKNLGLEDAAAGLRFVHAEVAAFGGDPEKITIMGESAGGQLVAGLLSREERQLVAGAIIQSGPLGAQKPAKAKRVTDILAKKLRVSANRAGFASVAPEKFVQARDEQMRGKTLLDGVPSFVFCLDAESLSVVPAEGVVEAQVPLLIGSNAEEYRLWFAPEALAKVTAFKVWLIAKALKISKQTVAECRRAFSGASQGEILGQLISDKIFGQPAVDAVKARKAPSYLYQMTWGTKKHGLGATHALELGMVFDALHTEGAKRMADDAPQKLADRMHADWVQFIKTQTMPWPEFAESGAAHRYDA